VQDLIGRSTGRYAIKREIGSGGMAVVYLAHDANLDVDVAIKFIRTDKLTEENKQKTLARFKREAQKTAHLEHPNIVKVTDFGEFEGTPFFVMRYIPGERTLKSLTGSPMPYQKAVNLILTIAAALQAAHEEGIIHRDVKPTNVLLTTQNIPMLADFGIAKVVSSEGKSETLTQEGTTVGTPEYMAPEQWHDSAVDARADIYSLGVVLYELLTGRPPFKGRNTTGTMIAVLTEPLPPPRNFAPDLPMELVRVVEKALAKKPEDRYDTMEHFIGALQLALSTSATPSAGLSKSTIVQTVPLPLDQSTVMEAPATPGRVSIAPPVTPAVAPPVQSSTQIPATPFYPPAGTPYAPSKPKSKAGLWIVLAVVGVGFIIGAVLLLKTLINGPTPSVGDGDIILVPTYTPFIDNRVIGDTPGIAPSITPIPLNDTTTLPSPTPVQAIVAAPLGPVLLVMSNGSIGNSDIYISNEDGSNFRCVACDQSCDESEPEWSPDRGSIIFQSNCAGSYDIWTVGVDGGTPWQLTWESQTDEREPSWSVNDQIAYRVSPKGENTAGVDDIYIAMIKSSGSPAGFTGRSPEWSPDGSKLAFMSDSPGTWQIFTFDLNSRSKQQVTSCSTGCRFPSWSPDGASIAANLTDTATSTNPAGIAVISVNGGSMTTLVSGYAGRPSWSANGWIAYNTSKGIEAVNVSSKQKKVLVDVSSAWGPCWSQ
jgi:serine/threonine protein kinase